jgi:hypothetical protein
MKLNGIMPEAYENKPAVQAANVSYAEECVDMCTLEYYCPQPIIGARLAHAYVPWQCGCGLYPADEGRHQGTRLAERGSRCGAEGGYGLGVWGRVG